MSVLGAMPIERHCFAMLRSRLVDEGTFHVRPKTIASVDVTPTGMM